MACLDENQVIALVHGRLTGEPLREAQEHLDRCHDCLELVGMFQQTTLDETLDHDFVPLSESVQIDLNAPPGSRIGRYEVIRTVGRGGMGVVYLARDPELDRLVALKLVRPSLTEDERSEHFERRLMREARAMAKLSHPNVLTIYDVGLHGEQVFLASEWIDGCTLDQWMAQGSHRWRSVVKRFAAAARGLAAAHDAGLVHRDFKPSNVMLGNDDRVHVFDFGLVKAVRPSEGDITTQLSGQFVVGTPAYMAPEQMTGEPADARSDQFSFSVALYEALAGRRPFEGRNVTELLARIGEGKIADTKNIPRWLGDVLRRGIRRDPLERYESMQAIVTLLERGIQRSRRRSALVVGSFGVAAALAAGLGYWGGLSEDVYVARVDIADERSDEFAQIDVLLEAHEYQQAIAQAEALVAVSSSRLQQAQLWSRVGKAHHAQEHYRRAITALEKSFYAAVAGKQDELAALATIEIYELYSVKLHDSEAAARWRGLAESAVERVASPQISEIWSRVLLPE